MGMGSARFQACGLRNESEAVQMLPSLCRMAVFVQTEQGALSARSNWSGGSSPNSSAVVFIHIQRFKPIWALESSTQQALAADTSADAFEEFDGCYYRFLAVSIT